MIDSHCHLDLPAFEDKLDTTLAQCHVLGITRILVPGLSVDQFNTILALKNDGMLRQSASQNSTQNNSSQNFGFTAIDIALGCHPYYLNQLNSQHCDKTLADLSVLAQQYHHDIVAIGECGLDSAIAVDMDIQYKMLCGQIEIANATKKPLILHHRKSHNALIKCLKEQKHTTGGVIHAFSGSWQIAKTYIDMGFLLGVGGTITYERSVKTQKAIQQTPLQYLLLETDAPDMPVFGFQGKPNSPTQLPLIASALAQIKKIDLQQVAVQTSANYTEMFG